MKIVVKIENKIETANPMSNKNAGIGINMNVKIRITPTANKVSPRKIPPAAPRAWFIPLIAGDFDGDGFAAMNFV